MATGDDTRSPRSYVPTIAQSTAFDWRATATGTSTLAEFSNPTLQGRSPASLATCWLRTRSHSQGRALSNIRQSTLVHVHVSTRAARGDGGGRGLQHRSRRLDQKQDHEVDPSLPEAPGALLSEGAVGEEVPDGEDGRVQENLAGNGIPYGRRGEEDCNLEVPVFSGDGED